MLGTITRGILKERNLNSLVTFVDFLNKTFGRYFLDPVKEEIKKFPLEERERLALKISLPEVFL